MKIIASVGLVTAMLCQIFHSVAAYQPLSTCRHFSRLRRLVPMRGSDLILKAESEKDPGEVKGTSLKILKYPNPKLRLENEEIVAFDESLQKLANEMLLVMYASDGIGLAAPQVGANKRLMVFNDNPDNKANEKILVNPQIIEKSNEKDVQEEGCLSFPQIHGDVIRSKWINIEYSTITGKRIQEKLVGWPARIFQHEYDHLDKILFIDRLNEKDLAINKKRLEKYIKKYGPGGIP